MKKLIPMLSDVNSREEVDLSVQLNERLTLNIPIIASPMKGISSPKLINEVGKNGGIGILHRFYRTQKELVNDVTKLNWPRGYSCGLNDLKLAKVLLDYGCNIFCIDVANGYLKSVRDFTTEVAKYITHWNYIALLMVGNVSTYEGAKELYDCGADLIRVGIGTGGQCTTKDVTGIDIPMLDALEDCSRCDATLVADGGVRTSGDIVKYIVHGADLVMIGSLFGRCKESSHNGIIYGMASRKLQEEYYHSTKSIEGRETKVKKDTTVKDLMNELTWGIKSACTYFNARNLDELRNA